MLPVAAHKFSSQCIPKKFIGKGVCTSQSNEVGSSCDRVLERVATCSEELQHLLRARLKASLQGVADTWMPQEPTYSSWYGESDGSSLQAPPTSSNLTVYTRLAEDPPRLSDHYSGSILPRPPLGSQQ